MRSVTRARSRPADTELAYALSCETSSEPKTGVKGPPTIASVPWPSVRCSGATTIRVDVSLGPEALCARRLAARAFSMPVVAMILPFGSATKPAVAPTRRTAQNAARWASTSRLGLKIRRSCMAARTWFSSPMRQIRRSSAGGAKLT